MQSAITNTYKEIVELHFGRTPPEDFQVVKHCPTRNGGAVALCLMWKEYRVLFVTESWLHLAAITLGYGPGTTEAAALEEFDTILKAIGEN